MAVFFSRDDRPGPAGGGGVVVALEGERHGFSVAGEALLDRLPEQRLLGGQLLGIRDFVAKPRFVTSFVEGPDGGLVVMADVFMAINVNLKLIIALAERYRLPIIYPFRFMTAAGGLMSYGIDVSDLWRRVPTYVDRILKGAKPAELPVQLPTKFELVINLKAARALRLDVPWFLQQRADEVIE